MAEAAVHVVAGSRALRVLSSTRADARGVKYYKLPRALSIVPVLGRAPRIADERARDAPRDVNNGRADLRGARRQPASQQRAARTPLKHAPSRS
eukprot:4628366-Pleurochrysis_carterae.AAC.2